MVVALARAESFTSYGVWPTSMTVEGPSFRRQECGEIAREPWRRLHQEGDRQSSELTCPKRASDITCCLKGVCIFRGGTATREGRSAETSTRLCRALCSPYALLPESSLPKQSLKAMRSFAVSAFVVLSAAGESPPRLHPASRPERQSRSRARALLNGRATPSWRRREHHMKPNALIADQLVC